MVELERSSKFGLSERIFSPSTELTSSLERKCLRFEEIKRSRRNLPKLRLYGQALCCSKSHFSSSCPPTPLFSLPSAPKVSSSRSPAFPSPPGSAPLSLESNGGSRTMVAVGEGDIEGGEEEKGGRVELDGDLRSSSSVLETIKWSGGGGRAV